jgi:hypothetical protein
MMAQKDEFYQPLRLGSVSGSDDVEFERHILVTKHKPDRALWIWRVTVIILFGSMNILSFIAFKRASETTRSSEYTPVGYGKLLTPSIQ